VLVMTHYFTAPCHGTPISHMKVDKNLRSHEPLFVQDEGGRRAWGNVHAPFLLHIQAVTEWGLQQDWHKGASELTEPLPSTKVCR
jgi:hypothetical protein